MASSKPTPAVPAVKTIAGLRITTSPDRQVACAGALWAGVSEVPEAGFSEHQLVQLRAHKALQVEDIELTVAEAPAT